MSEVSDSGDIRRQVRERLSWKIVPVALLTALIVYVLVGHLTDAREFRDALLGARWEWFGAVVALMGAILVLQAVRFRIVLGAAGYPLSLRRLLDVLLSVWPFVLIVPARINDLLRALKLRRQVPPSTCLGSVVAERFIDVQTLCLLGIGGCAVLGAWSWLGLLFALWAGGWTVVIAAVINVDRLAELPLINRFETKLRAFLHAFEALRDKPGHLAALFAVSTLVWMGSMVALGLLLWIFDAAMPAVVIVGLWPLALFAGMVPMTVGGMGTRDGAFLALLLWATDWSGAESAVLAASFGYGFVLVILPGIVGIPFMLRWMFGGDGPPDDGAPSMPPNTY